MGLNCAAFNSFLFRRTPDWDKELARDRHPYSFLYTSMYETRKWKSFTGTTHTWDKVHVSRPNDDGASWPTMVVGDNGGTICDDRICDPQRKFTGWGSTRSNYGKFHQDYQSPVFCLDQIRHVEEAEEQLLAIIEGHKKLSDLIASDCIRRLAVTQSDLIYICGQNGLTLTTTAAMFLANGDLDLGGVGNLPTSKLTMNYLDNNIETLMFNGYFDREWLPQGKFAITSDIQTQRELSNGNPALSAMYQAADFAKGGKFYAYGVMAGVGNWMFKIDPEPCRFQHIGSGILRRVWPYQNLAATVGKKPVFDVQYKNAKYQLFHVYNRAARTLEVGDVTSVNPDMKFGVARDLMGKWSWKSPDYFRAFDPSTGIICEHQNDKKNKGYFLAEYEAGMKSTHPEIEMFVIAQRGPQCVVDSPLCVVPGDWNANVQYQSLLPYNTGCPGSMTSGSDAW